MTEMSVAEMKNTIITVVQNEQDEKKLQNPFNVLSKHQEKEIGAEEACKKINARYSETLRRLAQ